jgi:hypothetical protein
MPISIKHQQGHFYTAMATPPHASRRWAAPEPVVLRTLIHELEALGCHQQDIADAFYISDPQWRSRL